MYKQTNKYDLQAKPYTMLVDIDLVSAKVAQHAVDVWRLQLRSSQHEINQHAWEIFLFFAFYNVPADEVISMIALLVRVLKTRLQIICVILDVSHIRLLHCKRRQLKILMGNQIISIIALMGGVHARGCHILFVRHLTPGPVFTGR